MNTIKRIPFLSKSVHALTATLLLGGLASAGSNVPGVATDGDSGIATFVDAVHFFNRIGCSFEYSQSVSSFQSYTAAIDGDVAAFGVLDILNPRVDVYERTDGVWSFVQSVTGTGATDAFGFGIAIADGIIIAGNALHKTGDDLTGSAQVFQKIGGTWTETQTLIPSEHNGFPIFGDVLDFDGKTLVVGASGARKVFVYEWSNGSFVETQILKKTISTTQFAFDVAVDGDVIAVGDIKGPGRVHIFERADGTWTETASFQGSVAGSYKSMGFSVAVADGRVYSSVQSYTDIGPTYTFEKVDGAWTETNIIYSDSGSQAKIAASGQTLMIGQSISGSTAPAEDFAIFADAVFVEYGTGCAGSGGFVPTLKGCGEPVSGGTVTLEIENAFGGGVGLLVMGVDEVSVPIGAQCTQLVTPLAVFPPLTIFGDGAGEGNLWIFGVVPNIPSTATVHLQAYIQDATPIGFTTTNGLRFPLSGT